MTQIQNSI